ncbi:ASCH domain-containing protein [Paenibacillus sp. J31TS4]|uniref:ASCH domain-containing protein n=1 Tax=Paenibacillus sp. J31TS4 TaxID=2807195 RepID=UPI001B075191|nr:ASCH domain-containing protein [Paenibacillus sp. J31TS4]GIP38708.1 ASCH domain-containing protein [Paenibacillus sp. J31TS4]
MKHKMGLYESPFRSMQAGRKTVEVRLYDEKRRLVQPGDTIRFTLLPGGAETLLTEVLAVHPYPTFRAMYEAVPAEAFDSSNETIEDMLRSTYTIYTPEQEAQWGTVAITVKVIPEPAPDMMQTKQLKPAAAD